MTASATSLDLADPAVVAAYLGTSEEEAEQELETHDQPELHVIDTSGDPLGHDSNGPGPVGGTRA